MSSQEEMDLYGGEEDQGSQALDPADNGGKVAQGQWR